MGNKSLILNRVYQLEHYLLASVDIKCLGKFVIKNGWGISDIQMQCLFVYSLEQRLHLFALLCVYISLVRGDTCL